MADGRRGAASRPLLIIMLKAPVMGRVKTRLAREIGPAEATRFARICARTVIQRLARDRRWRTLLAVAPDSALHAKLWPAHCRKIGQGGGDLGARMGRLLSPAFRPALLIGADIPGITPAIIADAFARLARSDVVLGPAEDGGYWLIGTNRGAPRRVIFPGVRWSTPHALADTVACFPGCRLGFAATLADVDDAVSHRRHAASAACVTPLPSVL